MNRIGQLALLCAALMVSGCATGQDAAPTTTASAPSTTFAPAPSSTTQTVVTTPSASSSTTASSVTLRDGSLSAGTYIATPFAEGPTICAPSQTGCIDPVGADSIRITFTIPDGWASIGGTIWLGQNAPPGGAGMAFNLGGWMYNDPCRHDEASADVPVGLTVDDFASALADNPLLEVTTPVDVTLGGYSGKYLDLQVPSDISGCDTYQAWEYWLRAQGPGHRWHLWILDVDGVRVVVQSMDYEGTSAEVQAELEAIVDSIQIEP